ncbi:ribosome biogenesis GTPase YlqF [Chitiniphilus eburneus]|uniref:Ribosome biogenesis GTPase A n=2 Tax=Chitiniphilus eburneus TaxID=2571148 RepID=A0A4U0Q8A4_9NEIS|nr:ribosome biogenesis GTPase YlqF [Chitiniphilus eburneus]TJZ77501.1 ribosome biogenesis GTPase YlqF [Chitiniphilus eburneus]
MSIQWYPGHMHAARKQVAETMAKVDLVIEVVDARLPGSSTNPMIDQLRRARQRPALKILNKADLADPALNARWLEWFRAQPATSAILMGEDNKQGQARKLPQYCRELAPHRTGAEKPLRAMIMGIPNVGKSTLINVLMSRRIANVADTPGVTKSQQRVETGEGFILYDTPGLLWPKIERPESGYRLALAGSVGRNAYNEEDVAWFAVETLQQRYPQLLAARYKLDDLSLPADELFNQIGKKRGAVLGGGRIDRQKTAELILTDFRSGTLGRITLESPDDFLLPPEPLAPTDHTGSADEDIAE